VVVEVTPGIDAALVVGVAPEVIQIDAAFEGVECASDVALAADSGCVSVFATVVVGVAATTRDGDGAIRQAYM
jgi:hypothetical protein